MWQNRILPALVRSREIRAKAKDDAEKAAQTRKEDAALKKALQDAAEKAAQEEKEHAALKKASQDAAEKAAQEEKEHKALKKALQKALGQAEEAVQKAATARIAAAKKAETEATEIIIIEEDAAAERIKEEEEEEEEEAAQLAAEEVEAEEDPDAAFRRALQEARRTGGNKLLEWQNSMYGHRIYKADGSWTIAPWVIEANEKEAAERAAKAKEEAAIAAAAEQKATEEAAAKQAAIACHSRAPATKPKAQARAARAGDTIIYVPRVPVAHRRTSSSAIKFDADVVEIVPPLPKRLCRRR